MPPRPAPQARVVFKRNVTWQNKHENLRFQTSVYDVWNSREAWSNGGLRVTVDAIQSLLRDARGRRELRMLGGGWSFSDILETEGWILNTRALNRVAPMTANMLDPGYAGDRNKLLFVQCGASISELNEYLATRKLALKTSGASNGQTFVGAMSTGTHGSVLDEGGVQDSVVGIHLVLGPDREIWLERASAKVANAEFASFLAAELVRDDTLFDAALVSFGCMGFIHGVLIETTELRLLEAHRQRMPLKGPLESALRTLKLDGIGLPRPERPFHFEVVVNPHELSEGVYVTSMYSEPFQTGQAGPDTGAEGLGPGDGVLNVIGLVNDSVPLLIPSLTNVVMHNFFKPYAGVRGTRGQLFSTTWTQGAALSMAMGVPLARATEVLDRLLELQRRTGPIAFVVGIRFVRPSRALLAFTRYSPWTCVIELDGPRSHRTMDFLRSLWADLQAAGIDFSLHWGKINDCMDATMVRRIYGDAVDRWVASRRQLLDDARDRAVFANEFLHRLGMA
jgi:FAD binding domain